MASHLSAHTTLFSVVHAFHVWRLPERARRLGKQAFDGRALWTVSFRVPRRARHALYSAEGGDKENVGLPHAVGLVLGYKVFVFIRSPFEPELEYLVMQTWRDLGLHTQGRQVSSHPPRHQLYRSLVCASSLLSVLRSFSWWSRSPRVPVSVSRLHTHADRGRPPRYAPTLGLHKVSQRMACRSAPACPHWNQALAHVLFAPAPSSGGVCQARAASRQKEANKCERIQLNKKADRKKGSRAGENALRIVKGLERMHCGNIESGDHQLVTVRHACRCAALHFTTYYSNCMCTVYAGPNRKDRTV